MSQSGNKKELLERYVLRHPSICCFNISCQWLHENCLFFLRVRDLQAITNLKIYDPDPEKSFTKATLARLKEEQREMPSSKNVETTKN